MKHVVGPWPCYLPSRILDWDWTLSCPWEQPVLPASSFLLQPLAKTQRGTLGPAYAVATWPRAWLEWTPVTAHVCTHLNIMTNSSRHYKNAGSHQSFRLPCKNASLGHLKWILRAVLIYWYVKQNGCFCFFICSLSYWHLAPRCAFFHTTRQPLFILQHLCSLIVRIGSTKRGWVWRICGHLQELCIATTDWRHSV